jgi:UDP-N-acetylmuramate: L-alanyl-gamma-D-glutamyl-meso-diaminopimelate ligase
MRIHLLGICGTLMAPCALLARHLGHEVSGSDIQLAPPMSSILQQAGIPCSLDLDVDHLAHLPPDALILVGNKLRRGMTVTEAMLNGRRSFLSAPAWLQRDVLHDRHVVVVAGTHGKTTTTAMIAWMMQQAGRNVGYLIGGLAKGFEAPAHLGSDPIFVIEGDEYDTAFFDKQAKFLHYWPKTLVLTTIEHDHLDIYPTMARYLDAFHFLVRLVPGQGHIVAATGDTGTKMLLERGCWSMVQAVGTSEGWQAVPVTNDASTFVVLHHGQKMGQVAWSLRGHHNMHNALAALVAVIGLGVGLQDACVALERFQGISRRLEVLGEARGITVVDDFAHHPGAVSAALAAMRPLCQRRLVVVLEPASNTMRAGGQLQALADSLRPADRLVVHLPEDLAWSLKELEQAMGKACEGGVTAEQVVALVMAGLQSGDMILCLSNAPSGSMARLLWQAVAAG